MDEQLSPDVRDRAAQAAHKAVIVGSRWEIVPEDHKAELYKMVDAVTAVVAPEIERPLKADGELAARAERATRQELTRTGLAAISDRDALQARIAELEGQLQRAESSGTGWVKAALQLGGNEERLQARIEELDAENLRLREQAGEMAEDLENARRGWNESIAQTGSTLEHVEHVERERDSLARRCAVRFEEAEKLKARVELLTAALTELTNAVVSWNGHPEPAHVMVMDAAAARARAVLAAGETESEEKP